MSRPYSRTTRVSSVDDVPNPEELLRLLAMSPIELQVDHMHSTESLGIQVCRLVYRDRAKSHVIVMLQGDNPLTNFDSALKLFKQAHPDFTYSITEDEKFRVTNGTATFEFERESNSYARTVVIAMLELMIERNKGDWS